MVGVGKCTVREDELMAIKNDGGEVVLLRVLGVSVSLKAVNRGRCVLTPSGKIKI